jgi:hypothetical protein
MAEYPSSGTRNTYAESSKSSAPSIAYRQEKLIDFDLAAIVAMCFVYSGTSIVLHPKTIVKCASTTSLYGRSCFQEGLLLTQVRRDPHQLRIALNAARNNLRVAAA